MPRRWTEGGSHPQHVQHLLTESRDIPNYKSYPKHMKWHTARCPELLKGHCTYWNQIDDSTGSCIYAHYVEELRCRHFAILRSCTNPNCQRLHTLSLKEREDMDARTQGVYKSFGLRPDSTVATTLETVHKIPKHQHPKELGIASDKIEAVSRTGFTKALSQHILKDFCLGENNTAEEDKGKIPLKRVFDKRESMEMFLRRGLEIEYCQVMSDMHRYDIEDCEVEKPEMVDGVALYKIWCEGLREKRPHLLRGDTIITRNNQTGEKHIGYIWFVRSNHVLVQFDQKHFQVTGKVSHKVQFGINDAPYDLQFHAIKKADTLLSHDEEYARLWRTDGDECENQRVKECIGADAPIEFNTAQWEAAVRLVSAAFEPGRIGLSLIHGPPGTGKTTTLVGFLQTLLAINADYEVGSAKRKRALVCCPSNHAADFICEKLIQKCGSGIAGNSLVRVITTNYDTTRVDPLVKKCIATHSEAVVKASLGQVVVCTLMSAGLLHSLGMEKGSFEHIIVDEAGQATEAQLCIGLLFASRDVGTHVTLAGDHKQLGAIVRSKVAQMLTFDRSTLERLIKNEELKDWHSTQLTESYRAHPDIMSLYNHITYNKTLSSSGNPKLTHALTSVLQQEAGYACHLLPNPNRPIALFHMDGTEDRELDSPSWANKDEARCIIDLVANLVENKYATLEEIVVLSSFQKQCAILEAAFHYRFHNAMEDKASTWHRPDYDRRSPPLRVFSVEQFQGREAKIVIISCVRSLKGEEVRNDILQGVGFIKQPKRLNVAISRAIAGLFIFGNIGLLQHDDHWKQIIDLISDEDPEKTCIHHLQASGNVPLTTSVIPTLKSCIRIDQPGPAAKQSFRSERTQHQNDFDYTPSPTTPSRPGPFHQNVTSKEPPVAPRAQPAPAATATPAAAPTSTALVVAERNTEQTMVDVLEQLTVVNTNDNDTQQERKALAIAPNASESSRALVVVETALTIHGTDREDGEWDRLE